MKYQGIRFLITMYLLLMLGLLIYLTVLTMEKKHGILDIAIMIAMGILALKILTFHPRDYDH